MKGNKLLWLVLLLSVVVVGATFNPWVRWILTGPLEEINEWYPSVGDWWLTLRVLIKPTALILTVGCIVALYRKR
ncbi:MAG TPA: hypothetical protein DCR04_00945 [Flavobacteriales bacterium]|nr:hypothetical protein [Flavobacteriales bacterium]